MAFTAKFGADGKGPADDVASSEWSDETSKALRDAGFKSECARLPIRGTVITEIGWHTEATARAQLLLSKINIPYLLIHAAVVRFGAPPQTFLYVGQANATNQPPPAGSG